MNEETETKKLNKYVLSEVSAMAAWYWSTRLVEGDRVKFATEVSRRVIDDIIENGKCHLVSGYDPCPLLVDALNAIGIECRGNFFSALRVLNPGEIWIYPEKIVF